MSSNALLWPSQGTIPERRLDKYKYLKIPSQGVGGIPALVENPLLALFLPIPDATFQFQRIYQIKKNQVPSTQTNMPIPIIDILGVGKFQEASGFDIRVFDSAGVPIPYEVEFVDTVTGAFIVWVNMATVKDGEFIQLTFGKPTATDGSTPNAVYDSNYKSVYHLNGVGIDSTSNAENFTIFGTTTVPAKIGQGLSFPGTVNDYLIRNPYSSFPNPAITCEFWIKTGGDGDGMVSYAIGVGALANHFLIFDQNNLAINIASVLESIGISFNDDTFHKITVTWRSSDGQLTIYDGKDVAFSGIHQQGASFTNNGSLVLGQDQDNVGGGFQAAQALVGILDEFRLSDISRDADYVTTSFNAENDNNAFWFRTPILENGVDNLWADGIGDIVTELIP